MIKTILISILEILFVGVVGCAIESVAKDRSMFTCGELDLTLNYFNMKKLPFIPIWAIGALILILLKGFFDWTNIMDTTSIWFYLIATGILVGLECVDIKFFKKMLPNLTDKIYKNAEKQNLDYWKGYKKDETILRWCNGRNSLKATVVFFICTIIFYKFVHPLFLKI